MHYKTENKTLWEERMEGTVTAGLFQEGYLVDSSQQIRNNEKKKIIAETQWWVSTESSEASYSSLKIYCCEKYKNHIGKKRNSRPCLSDFKVKQGQIRSKPDWGSIKNFLSVAWNSSDDWGDFSPSLKTEMKLQHLTCVKYQILGLQTFPKAPKNEPIFEELCFFPLAILLSSKVFWSLSPVLVSAPAKWISVCMTVMYRNRRE